MADSFNPHLKYTEDEYNITGEALTHEIELHKEYDVVKNKLFYNKARQLSTGFTTFGNADAKKKFVDTINSQEYKDTTGKEQARKQRETKSSAKWKDTTGKEMKRKMLETVNDPEYKEHHSAKQRETKSSAKWKDTTGKEMKRKISVTKNSPEWAEAKEIMIQKQKDLRKDKAWILQNTVICEHCNLLMVGKSNYTRWHGENCKHNEENKI